MMAGQARAVMVVIDRIPTSVWQPVPGIPT